MSTRVGTMRRRDTTDEADSKEFKFWFFQRRSFSVRELAPKLGFVRKHKNFFSENCKPILASLETIIDFPLPKDEIELKISNEVHFSQIFLFLKILDLMIYFLHL